MTDIINKTMFLQPKYVDSGKVSTGKSTRDSNDDNFKTNLQMSQDKIKITKNFFVCF